MTNSFVMTAALLAVIIGSLCFSVGEGLRLTPFTTPALSQSYDSSAVVEVEDTDVSLSSADSEARQIAGVIGGLTYVPKSLPSAEIVLDDLLLQWYTIEPGSVCIGKSIRDLEVRTATGASIVSIIEPDRVKRINPEADTVPNEGATLSPATAAQLPT